MNFDDVNERKRQPNFSHFSCIIGFRNDIVYHYHTHIDKNICFVCKVRSPFTVIRMHTIPFTIKQTLLILSIKISNAKHNDTLKRQCYVGFYGALARTNTKKKNNAETSTSCTFFIFSIFCNVLWNERESHGCRWIISFVIDKITLLTFTSTLFLVFTFNVRKVKHKVCSRKKNIEQKMHSRKLCSFSFNWQWFESVMKCLLYSALEEIYIHSRKSKIRTLKI